MIDFNRCNELFLKIYNDEKLCKTLSDYIKKNEIKIKFYLNFCRRNRWEICLKKSPMFKLCLVYAYLPTVKEKYEAKGISDKIFFDTMDDIRIWIDDHKERTGEYGLYELNWIMNHMKLSIFKIGRLQFQKFTYYFNPVYKKDGKEIKFGDKVLNIHIPRGEKLSIDECKKSIAGAQKFFAEFYPNYPTDRFICHSWLLYSANREYMKEDSNIIKFAEMFDIVKEFEEPSQAYLWLFGEKADNKALKKNKKEHNTYGETCNLPQTSSLQKNAVRYIENGGKLGDAMGVLIVKQ